MDKKKAKKIISDKILNIFGDSFLYNDGKEIRIPIEEDGEIIQIKVTLTAAKDLIINGAEIPSEDALTIEAPKSAVVSEEEKKNVSKLLASLGL